MPLQGTWFNEPGSEMNLTIKDGLVTGAYHTAVGDASGIYPLAGRADITADKTPRFCNDPSSQPRTRKGK